jgi:hypothetical protein
MNSIFSKSIFLFCIIIFSVSCDKDVNDIGANIVGEDHFGFMSDFSATVLAYNQKTDEVQTNNLPINQLGIYDNPAFGKTTASVGVQLLLNSVTPTLTNPVVTSVVLDIPYFSKVTDATSSNTDDLKMYVLDSIIGTKTNKLKLSIFKSTSDLREIAENVDFPNFTLSNSAFTTTGSRLNDSSDNSQNDEFFFDKKVQNTVILSTVAASGTTPATIKTTTTYQSPSMRINLNNSFGTDILAIGTTLLTPENFKKEFKGLYFKIEQSGASEGCLAMMNFKKGTVTINYTESATGTDTKTLVLNMSGNSVNLLNQANTSNYTNKINNPNTNAGDDRLYLKGGNGSVAHIDLFGSTNVVKYNRITKKIEPRTPGDSDNTPDELDYIKAKGWLINEANLVFTIDQSAMANSAEPNRIQLYNANNKIPIIDYLYDNSLSTATNYSKNIHGGLIQKISGKGNKYKIRLTNHIRNLINKDSTNVRLALAVNQNINNITFGISKNFLNYKTNFQFQPLPSYQKLEYAYKFFPTSSIMNPLGTVLYGTNVAPADTDKRLKLEIWYTKPN